MTDESVLIQSLHPLERKCLPHITEKTPLSLLLEKTGLQEVEVVRALQWLENKEICILEKKEEILFLLDTNGKEYRKKGLPEKRFLQEILTKELSLEEIKKRAGLDDTEATAVIGLLRKRRQIQFMTLQKIRCTEEGKKAAQHVGKEEEILQKAEKGMYLNECSVEEKQLLDLLLTRKEIIQKSVQKKISASVTALGKRMQKSRLDTALIESVTSKLLQEKTWENCTFRRYDIHSPVPKVYGGRIHPLEASMRRIRKSFLEMGFKEMEGPWVETAFWCMDAMWIPQDHPAREMQDTFYLPYKGTIPKELSQKVKEVQETGGSSGSKGYGYTWNLDIAKQLLLRTHTTATTFRYFGEKKIQPPAKYFYIGRIFRNEAMDATHLPEFHHSEGFVMEEGLTLRDLMGYIKEFYATLGIHKIKFKPTYNPYTEPSMEAIGYNEQLGKWIELINSGMFRPESLAPFGINVPVIAWGLGVERLAMMLHEEKNIRNMLGATADLEWLRRYRIRW